MPRLSFLFFSFLHSDKFLPVQSELGMFSLLLAFVGLSRLLLGSVSTCALGRLCCVASLSRGRFGFLRGKLCSSSHVGFHALLCDVTALARSWISPDGWLRGERPADRRALEGAVAKAGRVASRSSRESRVSRDVQEMFKRESAHTARCFKLSGFGHRPQAAGPIRASVRDGAPPARLLLQGTFM